MEDTKERKITITSIEQKTFANNTKVVLSEDKDKYNLWKNKKDGTPTVAWTQFAERTPGIGSTVTVIYREEDKEYNGHPYKERTIVFFPTEETVTSQNTPITTGRVQPTPAYSTGNAAHIGLEDPTEELAALEKNTVVKLKLVANDHEKRLKVLEKFLTE